eukprot:Rmarinus@m.7110
MSIPTFELNTGAKLPAIGLGTWNSAPGEVGAAVTTALEAGYTHIDCAYCYQNEKEVGEAFSKAFGSGKVKREDVFVTSKLWLNHTDPADVVVGCKQTLSDLQLDYLDLYLLHWPVKIRSGQNIKDMIKPEDLVDPNHAETWKAMEGLVKAGLVRAIGISNFSISKLTALLESVEIVPAVNQVEVHPWWRQDELIAFCKSKGIHVTAYSPLGSPGFTAGARKEGDITLLEEPAVLDVAKKLGKTPGQVILRWGFQHGTSIIPKSVTPARIQSNLNIFDFELSPEDFQAISSLSKQERMVKGKIFVGGVGGYKTLEELWA